MVCIADKQVHRDGHKIKKPVWIYSGGFQISYLHIISTLPESNYEHEYDDGDVSL
jgi:hypothetical protein